MFLHKNCGVGAYLEGEGSSWPRRDMMLINVLIPEEQGAGSDRRGRGHRQQKRLTLLPHVHVVDLSVPVLGLADAAIGQGVAGVVGVHAKVEVMAGVSHGELGGGVKVRAS